MIKFFIILAIASFLAFAPGAKTEFVLDDHYTIVRNPLIKQPALYPKIFSSQLFYANPSSGYIKLTYYRPVLQSSYILDYKLFKLNPVGYQWINWCIHVINTWLVFILISLLFNNPWLAFLTALLFTVVPSHEWVVRYITGRGDSLQTLFGLVALITFRISLQSKKILGYVVAFISMVLSILTREFGYLLPLYALLIAYAYPAKENKIIRFSLGWIIIGMLSLVVTSRLLEKLGPIQALHFWYFTSIGLCLGICYVLLKIPWGKWIAIALSLVLAILSLSQRPYWESEEKLLHYTHNYEKRSYTAAHQQLLMKYEDNPQAIRELIEREKHPILKSLWFWRLGELAFKKNDLVKAGEYFDKSLEYNSTNLDALNARAVVFFEFKEDQSGFHLLEQAYKYNPTYPPTLQNLGVYYLSHSNPDQASKLFQQARYYQGY